MNYKIALREAYLPYSTYLKRLALVATLILAMALLILALWPNPLPTSGLINDKILHFIAFAALVLPCAIFLARYLFWIVPLAVLFGGSIELLQPEFGRQASWADFLADILGVAAGVAIGLAVRSLIKRYVNALK